MLNEQFTSEEALEEQGTDDAYLIDWKYVQQICKEHGANPEEFAATEERIANVVDAGNLMVWLGY
jgi:hypothetical protein